MSEAQFGRMLPLWYQTGELLRQHIHHKAAAGELRLPTESQLAEQFGVSMNTVRQALAALEHEGLISRMRRRGTVINPMALRSSDIKVWGTLPSVWNTEFKEPPKLLAKRKVKTPAHLAAPFAPASTVTYMQRLRRVDDVPTNYCVNYVVPQLGDQITREDIERWPISRILRDKLNVGIARMDYSVEALGASGEVAKFLELAEGTPVLFFRANVYDAGNRLLEVGEIYYRAESFKFEVSINMR